MELAQTARPSFEHPEWIGFNIIYDLFFTAPFYLSRAYPFFSLSKGAKDWNSKKGDLRKALILECWFWIALGMLHKNAPFFLWLGQIRLGSVLGRNRIAGLITTVLYLNWLDGRRLMIVGVIFWLYYAAVFLILSRFELEDLRFEGEFNNRLVWSETFLPGRLPCKGHSMIGNPWPPFGNLSPNIGPSHLAGKFWKTSSLQKTKKLKHRHYLLNSLILRCSLHW